MRVNVLFNIFVISARRIAAEGKRKIKTEEEELAGECYKRVHYEPLLVGLNERLDT